MVLITFTKLSLISSTEFVPCLLIFMVHNKLEVLAVEMKCAEKQSEHNASAACDAS